VSRKPRTYTISAVADQYGIHPQTLRLYEREGLLKPSRSEGNTRLYTDPDLERLELILSLTRDLGVNLAGVEIILNMREKMDAMQHEFERFFQYLQSHAEELTNFEAGARRERRACADDARCCTATPLDATIKRLDRIQDFFMIHRIILSILIL
jgi:MerR family transcriptional regulator/heat shock protein HspR